MKPVVKNESGRDFRLPAAFWALFGLFCAAALWRLVVLIWGELDPRYGLDFLVTAALLGLAAARRDRWRDLLAAGALVFLALYAGVFNRGFITSILAIKANFHLLLTLRYASDMLYFAALVAAAVFLVLHKGRACAFSAVGAAVLSFVYSALTVLMTSAYFSASNNYEDGFSLAFTWWSQNLFKEPVYFVATLSLALTLVAFKYYDLTAPARKKRRQKLAETKSARRRGA